MSPEGRVIVCKCAFYVVAFISLSPASMPAGQPQIFRSDTGIHENRPEPILLVLKGSLGWPQRTRTADIPDTEPRGRHPSSKRQPERLIHCNTCPVNRVPRSSRHDVLQAHAGIRLRHDPVDLPEAENVLEDLIVGGEAAGPTGWMTGGLALALARR